MAEGSPPNQNPGSATDEYNERSASAQFNFILFINT